MKSDNRSWFERKTAKIFNYLFSRLCPNTFILNDRLTPFNSISIDEGDEMATNMAGHWLVRMAIDNNATKFTLTFNGLTIDEPSGRVKHGDWEVKVRRIDNE